jgi:hypothetical protein
MTKAEACQRLAVAGIAAGPCLSDAEVVHDPMSPPGPCW